MISETYQLWDDREDVKLTTFLHAGSPIPEIRRKRPAVLVIPGGAYLDCLRNGAEADTIAYTFAMDGFHTFVLQYSVKTTAPEGKTLFPAQLLDYGKAILFIREHAEEWCVDVDKISIIGFSAGGHLCAMVGTTWHAGLLSGFFHEDPNVFKPLCVMCIYAVLDYLNWWETRRPEEDFFSYVFGSRNPDRELLKQYSPVYLVNENTPPFFLAAARDDTLVPAVETLDMAQALHKAGIPYELYMCENGDHGFSLGRDFFEPWALEKAHSCAAWVPLAKTFLMHQVNPSTAEDEKEVFKKLMEVLPPPKRD